MDGYLARRFELIDYLRSRQARGSEAEEEDVCRDENEEDDGDRYDCTCGLCMESRPPETKNDEDWSNHSQRDFESVDSDSDDEREPGAMGVWSTVSVSATGTVTKLLLPGLSTLHGSFDNVRAIQLSLSSTSGFETGAENPSTASIRSVDGAASATKAVADKVDNLEHKSGLPRDSAVVDVANAASDDTTGENLDGVMQLPSKERDFLFRQIVRFDQAPVSITRSEDWLGTWSLATQRKAEAKEEKKRDKDELPWHVILRRSKMVAD